MGIPTTRNARDARQASINDVPPFTADARRRMCLWQKSAIRVAPMMILEIAAGVALAPVIAFLVLAVIGLLIRFWMPIAVVAACVAIWLAGIVTYYQAPA